MIPPQIDGSAHMLASEQRHPTPNARRRCLCTDGKVRSTNPRLCRKYALRMDTPSMPTCAARLFPSLPSAQMLRQMPPRRNGNPNSDAFNTQDKPAAKAKRHPCLNVSPKASSDGTNAQDRHAVKANCKHVKHVRTCHRK